MKFARSAAMSALIAAGVGLAGLGAATAFPEYHCPGHPHWSYGHCLGAKA